MPYDLVGNKPVIYIHIPKTAGTSLKHYFQMQRSGHLTSQESYNKYHLTSHKSHDMPYLDISSSITPWLNYGKISEKAQKLGKIFAAEEVLESPKTKWQQAYKFSFVRNPWDRLSSIYHHHREDFGGLGSYKSFVTALHKDTGKLAGTILQLTQTQYLSNNGSINLQFIGRYENLKYDAQRLDKHLTGDARPFGEWERRSSNKDTLYTSMYPNFQDVYSVFSLYYEDIKNFKYTFSNTIRCPVTQACFKSYREEHND